jgi:NAD(P)-dependent dehydrogenase (short-subunit alcohol dehydrogenase family)
MNVLVTGANRGIGLEFARQYVGRGEVVFAAVRNLAGAGDLEKLACDIPDRLHLLELDVAEEESIAASVEQVRSHVNYLDLLVNCAAIYNADGSGWGVDGAVQAFGNLSTDAALKVWRVNVVAPMLLTQVYYELLQGSLNPRVANISSSSGSLHEKTYGGEYYYGTSKAALNFVTRSLAADLISDGIIVIAFNPGWVQTDMGGRSAPLTAKDTAKAMVEVVDRLTPQQSSQFLNRDGTPHAW